MSDIVAADAWPRIDAFRRAGSPSFETLGVEGARRAYEANCAVNGLERIEMRTVTDTFVNTRGAPGVRVRKYHPRSAPDRASVILFLHGGGWVIGSLETHDTLCRWIAQSTKCIVVAVDYRLAPEHPFPAALDDARAVLKWLTDESEHRDSKIAIMGDSAGGGLAAVLVNEHDLQQGSGSRPLSAQVLLYPVTDLRMATASYRRITHGFPLTAVTMSWFADLYAPSDLVDRRQESLSPLLADLAGSPTPAFVCTVGLDPLADEGIGYAAKLARGGGRVVHHHLPHHAHGLFTSAGVIPTARDILEQAAHFVIASLADVTLPEASPRSP